MNRNKQTEILGGILTVIILILLIFLSNIELNKVSYLENVASSIVNPIQRIMMDIKNKIQGNSAYFSNMDSIIAENEELKKRNIKKPTMLNTIKSNT